mmetsp:Transcript_123826/g.214677  ORF Transcript_123826/g.214677 Transcript_123826/m.214677 type:complete len:166 (+) Transcript_123826:110-607(+)
MAVFGGDITEFIDKAACECLNVHADHKLDSIFEGGPEFIKSDTDHELLLKVAFRQPIKLSGIGLVSTPDEEDEMPAEVRIFQGKPSIGFAEGEEEASVQDLNFTKDNLAGGEVLPVRFVKFQNVSTLQLYFKDNAGGAQTILNQIKFMGEPAEKMDMKDWKPIKG